VSDGVNVAIGETISLSMDNDGLRLDPVDYAALRALYESTDGENWENNRGWSDWNFGSEIPPLASIAEDWYGINLSGNQVISIDWEDTTASSNGMRGSLPAELGDLSELQRLDLSGVLRSGIIGKIPPELGQLKNLEYLNLYGNSLSGEIPPELGQLENLEFLNLGLNPLEGSIPSELGDLTELKMLILGGMSPYQSSLSGGIPAEFGNLQNLEVLALWSNKLSGEIPNELLNLDNLKSLYLQNNELTGFVPSGLIEVPTLEMPNLVNIDLSNNNFGTTVTNTADSGVGSLRYAIGLANAHPGLDLISFDISTSDPDYNATTGAFTIQPLSALPTITDSIVIDGTSQTGYSDRPLIELDGSNAGASVDGLGLSATDSIIRGLAINRFSSDGIQAAGARNTFSNNFLGTDVTGTVDLGNGVSGLFIGIGDSDIVEDNLISGNATGFETRGNNAIVRRNLIGTDITGTLDLGNDANGLSLYNGASNNQVGSTSETDRNIIAGNDSHGILIDGSNNRIQGNYIGVDITGKNALANNGQGIRLSAASGGSGNLIGGTEAGAGNVIANGSRGIVVYADNTTIQGNLIGTDATGTRNFGANSQAIRVEANGAIIGGSTESARNIISGSKTAQGISLIGNTTTIQGNYIGTDITGTQAIPNAQSGIYLFESSTNNLIGGTGSGEGNMIANNNGGIGVQGIASINNTIAGNSLFSNNGVGISILEGANAGRLAPTLTTAIRSDNQTRIAGNLTAPASTTVRVEFFSDATTEGRQYLGASNVTTDGAGNATFDVILDQKATGQNITATVTDATGNTSKLSSPRPLT
jgi:hypothetical protein